MFKKEVLSQLYRTGDRRRFLKACGVLGLGLAGGGVLQAVFKVVKIDNGLLKVSQTRLAMGTYVTMTAVHASRDQAQEAIGRAFEEIDRLVALFSRYDSATPVSVLNREGTLADPPPELIRLLKDSLYFHRASRGAFDVTVLPLVDLFEKKTGAGKDAVPTRAEIEDALERVGSEHVDIAASGRVRFGRPAMGITLDGIAKGYIVDRAAGVLADHGVANHLINAGGDIRTSGRRSEEQPWTVAIEDPRKNGRYPDVIRMTSGAVATSGNYEIYYDTEKMFHHVVDPRTGTSPHHSTSVSVRAESVMRADALSTAVFVQEPADGIRFVDSLERCECLVIDESGAQFRSRGWRRPAAA
jgi:thiamine biosynthesis lipoprotein